jgi:hypothetical protein
MRCVNASDPELGEDAEDARQHVVARHDADDVAVAPEGGLGAAPGVGVVDEVVVEERGGVQQLHREGDAHARLVVGAHERTGQEADARPQALAAGTDEVAADRLDEGDVGAQLGLDPDSNASSRSAINGTMTRHDNAPTP